MEHYPPEADKGKLFASNPDLAPVPVIASFDTNGKIIPLYLRYEGLKLKVDHIRWASDCMEFVKKFCCEITLQDRVQQVIVYYHKKTDLWTMERFRES